MNHKELGFEEVSRDCSIVNEDSLKILELIQEDSVDLILTDPPYNIGKFMHDRNTNMGKLRENHFSATNWDNLEYSDWYKHMDIFLNIKVFYLLNIPLMEFEAPQKGSTNEKVAKNYEIKGLGFKMNFIYEGIEKKDYENLKSFLHEKIGVPVEEVIQYCIEALKFSNSGGSLSVRYYKTKKLMLQGDLKEIDVLVKEIEENLKLIPKNSKANFPERSIDKDFFLGFDEAGKGETFGSLFLSGAKIQRENLEYLKGMLGNKNIKRMDKNQIENLFNAIKHKFSYEIKQKSSKEIDSLQINTLLDRAYVELIEKLSNDPSKEALFLDDYGVGHELKTKTDELRNNGSEVVISVKADINYLACSIASLVSRRARLIEMDNLAKNNIIIDPDTGEKVLFQSGSASDSETERYLITYRKLYPFSDFPFFVRTKWGNVRAIERKFPKKETSISFTCKYCSKEGHKICLVYNPVRLITECFCPECGKETDIMELRGFFKNKDIVIDTSAIITRIVSKDIKTSKHLEGCNFIIPSMLYEELDSKQPDIKTGGTKEIEELRRLSDNSQLTLTQFDVEDYSDVANDKKFLRVLRAKNGVMLTKDWNLAGFSGIGEFVIQVVDSKESYLKRVGLI